MTRYEVITAPTTVALSAEIQKRLFNKWQLQGGVAVGPGLDGKVVFAQAMILPAAKMY